MSLRLLLPAALALAAVAPPAVAAPPAWKAGFGRATITPDRPMWMSGYGSRTAPAEGKDTDLWARAMVLEDPAGKRLVLVALDLVGIDRSVSQAACRLIEQKHKVAREAVSLASSHTHCGPVVRGNLRSMYDLDEAQSKLVDEYGQKLPGLILEAVDKAAAAVEPVSLAWATGTAGFAVNRRENKEPQVPALRAKGALQGPNDHDVPVLAARDAKGAIKGVVFGYACHATVLSYQRWNADYPGYAAAGIEAAHPGATALFVAGCGADQNPLPRRTVELAKEYGRQLAAAVDAVLAGSMAPLPPGPVATTYREIDLKLAPLPSRDQFVQESQSTDKLLAGRAKMLLKRLDAEGSLPQSYPYPVQTWRFGGDLIMVMLGGEVVVDYALRLKKELPAGKTWVVAYANDVMAYIPSQRVLREGRYEGATSMVAYGLPTVWGPALEEGVVAEVHRQAKAGGK